MGQYQSDEIGNSFGRYRIVHKIGQGGMADVFLALFKGRAGFNKLVVLKVIRAGFGDDPDAVAMFLDEARLAGRLNHPNVVQTSEVSEIEGRHTIVMEYLEGKNLSEIVGKDKQVCPPSSMFLRVLSEALQGLHYVHELNGFDGKSLDLVHRDVSPQNIFVTYDGQVKLLDFGIAKAAISLCETRAGMMKGKISYMAPEQLSHENLDRRADIYGTGAVLYSLLSGERLWKGLAPAQSLINLLSGSFPSPSSLCPNQNPELERICLKALSRNPHDRYQTALEMRQDLEAVIESFDDKSTLRDLGNLISERFAEARAELKSRIQLTVKEPAGDNNTVSALGRDPSNPMLNQSRPSVVTTRVDGSLSGFQNSVRSLPESSIVAPNPTNKSRRNLAVALCTAGLALASVLFFLGARNQNKNQDSKTISQEIPTPQIQTASKPLPPDSKPEQKTIEISTTPSSARVWIDDREVFERPVVYSSGSVGKEVSIRVSADGFDTRNIRAVTGQDSRISVTLSHLPAATHRAKSSESEEKVAPSAVVETPPKVDDSPAAARARARDSVAAGKRPPRGLDSTNPWGE